MWDLKAGEFLDYFRDGVNGLSVREQAVGDGRDDVKGTFQELPGVGSIQLPGAKDAIDAISGENQRPAFNLKVRPCLRTKPKWQWCSLLLSNKKLIQAFLTLKVTQTLLLSIQHHYLQISQNCTS